MALAGSARMPHNSEAPGARNHRQETRLAVADTPLAVAAVHPEAGDTHHREAAGRQAAARVQDQALEQAAAPGSAALSAH